MSANADITMRSIALQLSELAEEMITLGAMGEMGIHGRELIGVGQIAASWAATLEKEMHDDTHPRTDD